MGKVIPVLVLLAAMQAVSARQLPAEADQQQDHAESDTETPAEAGTGVQPAPEAEAQDSPGSDPPAESQTVTGAEAAPEPAEDAGSASGAAADEDSERPGAAADATETIPVVPLQPEAPALPAEAEEPVQLDEVMVTANKRQQSERSLAGAVSAVTRERLDEAGASTFGDYLSLSPGVNFNSGTPGYSVITIRGISSDTIPGLAQTAVGTYYDDIPLTDPAAPMVVPDIDAYDADRIEVLRGPQGALYGSASLGGAVNYIPQAPDPHNFWFNAQASGDLRTNSNLGGSGKLMANLPLPLDGTALRVVGYYTDTPGYIDNLGIGRERSNGSATAGGRAILGFTPTPDSRLHLTLLSQRTRVDDAGYVDQTLGDLRKTSTKPEPSHNRFLLGSLRYELDTGLGNWAFVGGYQDKSSGLEYDAKNALGLSQTGQQVQTVLTQAGGVRGYSAELRYISPEWERFDFLAGAAYADRSEQFEVVLDLEDLQANAGLLRDTLATLGLSLPSQIDAATTLFREYAEIEAPETALFVDGNLRLTDTVKLAAGGRYYRNAVDSRVLARGLLVAPGGSTEYCKENRQAASGFNPKISLSWQASDDILLYGLYSRGYRLGGPNLVPSTPVTPTAQFYGPDEVRNYEVGLKTAWLDGALTVDLSNFWIDWKQIPLILMDRAQIFKYIDNFGNARSMGVELSVAARPFSFLTARSSLTWLAARLLNDFDPNNGLPPAEAGDRLPGAPEWTATTSLIGKWTWDTHMPSLALIHRYESASATNLSFQDVEKGDFHLLDARANAQFGHFTVAVFGKNLTDVRGTTASNNYKQPSGEISALRYITPPRTFGLELNYAFE